MNLLIITQKVDINDDNLSFFHGWLLEFAKNVEKLTVICLYQGEHELPSNVKVLSLGKENNVSKIKYILNFYKYIWQERKNYDSVFVHMNQIYIILGGLFWRAWGKKVSLWYAHGGVSFSLRIAEKLANNIFTSTQSGFRLKSNKLNIVGQGIDTSLFKPKSKKETNIFEIIYFGRISPVKDLETAIEATEILHKKGEKIRFRLVGGAGRPSQENYLKGLKDLVSSKGLDDIIKFTGPMPHEAILGFLQESDLHINTSHTGSLDKTVLEAMAVDIPILTCNEALKEVLGEYTDQLMFYKKDSKSLADKIEGVIKMGSTERGVLGQKLREIVISDHSLSSFIKKIIGKLK